MLATLLALSMLAPAGSPEGGSEGDSHPMQLVEAQKREGPPPAPASIGLEQTFCDGPSPCGGGDFFFGVGPAASNFGGAGMTIGGWGDIYDASTSLLKTHVQVLLDGHFNGLGATAPGGRLPQGELDSQLSVGLGVLGRRAFRGGFSPFAFLHVVSGEIASLDGSAIYAYTPAVEVGLIGHSVRLGDGFVLSLRGGGDFLYANGALSELVAPGVSDARVHFRVDPLGGATLLLAQRLTGDLGLHAGAMLSDVPEGLGAGLSRQLVHGRFWLWLRIGGLLTGPSVTVFSSQRQAVGSAYVGAPPETNVSWMFGI